MHLVNSYQQYPTAVAANHGRTLSGAPGPRSITKEASLPKNGGAVLFPVPCADRIEHRHLSTVAILRPEEDVLGLEWCRQEVLLVCSSNMRWLGKLQDSTRYPKITLPVACLLCCHQLQATLGWWASCP